MMSSSGLRQAPLLSSMTCLAVAGSCGLGGSWVGVLLGSQGSVQRTRTRRLKNSQT